MNKKRKILLSVLLLIFISIFTVLFFNSKNNIKDTSTYNGTITVGTSGTYYPFTYLDNGNLNGFEIDVWNAIGKELNYKIEFKTASFSGLFGMLDSGKVDTLANQITVTNERKEKYDFTTPTTYSGAQIVVNKGDSSITNVQDLKGKKVGVDLGSNYEQILKSYNKDNSFQIITYQNTDAAFNELLLHRIQAVVIDRVSAISTIKEKNLDLQLAGPPIDKIENAYPFNKNNVELMNKVNFAIQTLEKNGTLKSISEKWFETNITSPSTNIDYNANLTGNTSKSSTFDFMYTLSLLPLLLKAVKITLSLSILGMMLGLFVGIVLSIIRIYKVPILKQLAELYISFFRGTPLLVQLFLLYFGLPQIFPALHNMSAYTASLIGLGLNASAYIAEILRSSIDAIDKGQMEACLSLGMSYAQGLRRVVLPQAFRIAIPPLGNIFVDTVKGSSLAFTLGVVDILATAQMAAASSYKFFESYVAVAIIYWVIILIFNALQRKLERKLSAY
ncbi:MAG: ABC transporter permease subunit [Clostridium sp.]